MAAAAGSSPSAILTSRFTPGYFEASPRIR